MPFHEMVKGLAKIDSAYYKKNPPSTIMEPKSPLEKAAPKRKRRGGVTRRDVPYA